MQAHKIKNSKATNLLNSDMQVDSQFEKYQTKQVVTPVVEGTAVRSSFYH
jgi:hypothetical protein